MLAAHGEAAGEPVEVARVVGVVRVVGIGPLVNGVVVGVITTWDPCDNTTKALDNFRTFACCFILLLEMRQR